jgi:hypothetical protein
VEAEAIVEDDRRLLKLAQTEIVPYPSAQLVKANRHLILHDADVPVLLSAVASHPDWLLTNNTKHFTKIVAQKTSLRIASPADFFRTLSVLFE